MNYDIVIYGSGHAGACLRMMLDSIPRLKVLLVAPPYHPTPANLPKRLLAISKGSLDIISQFIPYDALLAIGQPIERIKVLDESDNIRLDFCPHDVASKDFGLMIQEDHLHSLLHTTKCNIQIKVGTIKTITQTPNTVEITLDDGLVLQSSLLLAADGKHSPIRKKLGLTPFKHDYRQSGLVCDVEHQHPHHGTAVEKFMPSGPFAILPRQNSHTSSVVWSVKTEWQQAFKQLPPSLQHQFILQNFPASYGTVHISSLTQFFPLHLQVVKKPMSGRVLLMGDAAHAMHPLAGQGFNLTVRDLGLLHTLISDQHRLGLDAGCELMLKKYNRLRKFDTDLLLESTHYINAIFSNNSNAMRIFRNIGMGLIDKIPYLKNHSMLYAMHGMA